MNFADDLRMMSEDNVTSQQLTLMKAMNLSALNGALAAAQNALAMDEQMYAETDALQPDDSEMDIPYSVVLKEIKTKIGSIRDELCKQTDSIMDAAGRPKKAKE